MIYISAVGIMLVHFNIIISLEFLHDLQKRAFFREVWREVLLDLSPVHKVERDCTPFNTRCKNLQTFSRLEFFPTFYLDYLQFADSHILFSRMHLILSKYFPTFFTLPCFYNLLLLYMLIPHRCLSTSLAYINITNIFFTLMSLNI
jgi:hypothetical protein